MSNQGLSQVSPEAPGPHPWSMRAILHHTQLAALTLGWFSGVGFAGLCYWAHVSGVADHAGTKMQHVVAAVTPPDSNPMHHPEMAKRIRNSLKDVCKQDTEGSQIEKIEWSDNQYHVTCAVHDSENRLWFNEKTLDYSMRLDP